MLCLINLCVSSIVREFARFYFAFKESNDDILKRNLEFLKRKYSFELASKLFEERKLEDKYLEFLLNEYLNVLHGQWLKSNNDPTFSEDILCRLPKLTKISFPIRCCDEDVKNIARFCPEVSEIDVKESRVTDDGIKYLCRDENGKSPCPELKKLFIEGCYHITDEGIKCIIQNLPSLEFIDYNPTIPQLIYSIHKEDYENMHIYNFTCLNFSEVFNLPDFTDILKTCLNVCPKLKSLGFCKLSDERQLNLLNNISLEALDLLFSENAPKININSFLKNKGCNLTSLGITSYIMSITELAENCPKLNFLWLNDVTFIGNDDSQPIFHNLDKCNFWNMRDDSSTIKAMSYLLLFSPKLESVGFMNCILSPDTKTDIIKCCEKKAFPLKKILFMWTSVDVKFVKDILLDCPSLIILYLKNNGYNCYSNCNNCNTCNNIKGLVKLAKTLPNKPQIEINNWPKEILQSKDF